MNEPINVAPTKAAVDATKVTRTEFVNGVKTVEFVQDEKSVGEAGAPVATELKN